MIWQRNVVHHQGEPHRRISDFRPTLALLQTSTFLGAIHLQEASRPQHIPDEVEVLPLMATRE